MSCLMYKLWFAIDKYNIEELLKSDDRHSSLDELYSFQPSGFNAKDTHLDLIGELKTTPTHVAAVLGQF